MKFKLDENLGLKAVEVLRIAGYDVSTVPDQKLFGIADKRLIEICQMEGRCLITLDVEFSNPFRFKPSDYQGIVVLRLPSKPSYQDLTEVIRTFIVALGQKEIHGKLWIVQRKRVREYREYQSENDGNLEF